MLCYIELELTIRGKEGKGGGRSFKTLAYDYRGGKNDLFKTFLLR